MSTEARTPQLEAAPAEQATAQPGAAGEERLRHPAWERLEDQIGWYDRKSGHAQRWYKRMKVAELAVATSVPPLASLGVSTAVVAAVSSVVVLLEGLQHLLQYHDQWIGYRATSEALRHERYLYLAEAGPYATASNPVALLAERVEGLVSQEQSKWQSTQQHGTEQGSRG